MSGEVRGEEVSAKEGSGEEVRGRKMKAGHGAYSCNPCTGRQRQADTWCSQTNQSSLVIEQ